MAMARLILDLNKSVEENASLYYEKAKKIKKKIAGAEEALKRNLAKLKELESKNRNRLKKSRKSKPKEKKNGMRNLGGS